MKRILILANTDIVIYNFRYELIKKLIHSGYEVYISATILFWEKELTDIGCILINTAIDRRSTNPIQDIKLLFQYMKLMRKIKPDILLTYTVKPNIYGNLANYIYNIPSISSITGLGTALEKKGMLQSLLIFLYKISFKTVDCVYFQNHANKTFFDSVHIKMKKTILVPGSGVNLENFRLMPYPFSNTINFIYIGRVMKDKGIDELLVAAEYIKNKYENVLFHICGFCEDGYENIMTKYNHQLIEYHGMIKNVKTILETSNCVILPSYHEGMSNSLLEAAAVGRPILASNIPGCSEIVEEGKTGFLFSPQDPHSLIEAIENFLNLTDKEKESMGIAGRKKIEKEFDRATIVDSYFKEIKNLIKK